MTLVQRPILSFRLRSIRFGFIWQLVSKLWHPWILLNKWSTLRIIWNFDLKTASNYFLLRFKKELSEHGSIAETSLKLLAHFLFGHYPSLSHFLFLSLYIRIIGKKCKICKSFQSNSAIFVNMPCRRVTIVYILQKTQMH